LFETCLQNQNSKTEQRHSLGITSFPSYFTWILKSYIWDGPVLCNAAVVVAVVASIYFSDYSPHSSFFMLVGRGGPNSFLLPPAEELSGRNIRPLTKIAPSPKNQDVHIMHKFHRLFDNY